MADEYELGRVDFEAEKNSPEGTPRSVSIHLVNGSSYRVKQIPNSNLFFQQNMMVLSR